MSEYSVNIMYTVFFKINLDCLGIKMYNDICTEADSVRLLLVSKEAPKKRKLFLAASFYCSI